MNAIDPGNCGRSCDHEKLHYELLNEACGSQLKLLALADTRCALMVAVLIRFKSVKRNLMSMVVWESGMLTRQDVIGREQFER